MKTVIAVTMCLFIGSMTVNNKIFLLEIPVLIIFGLLARGRKIDRRVNREIGFSYKDPWE